MEEKGTRPLLLTFLSHTVYPRAIFYENKPCDQYLLCLVENKKVQGQKGFFDNLNSSLRFEVLEYRAQKNSIISDSYFGAVSEQREYM